MVHTRNPPHAVEEVREIVRKHRDRWTS
jgi:hypothetical protein